MSAMHGTGLVVNDKLNIGSERTVALAELAEVVIAEVNSTSKIRNVSALEDRDMKRRQPDPSHMQTAFERDLPPLRGGFQCVLNEERLMEHEAWTAERFGWF